MTPYFILAFGFIFSLGTIQFSKYNETKIYIKLIVSWICVSEKRTRGMVQNCLSYSNRIISSETINNEILHHEPMLFSRLNGLSLEKAVCIFISNIKSSETIKLNAFNLLIPNINYLTEVEKEIVLHFDQANKDFIEIGKAFNITLETIEELYFDACFKYKQNNIFDLIFDKHNKMFKNLWELDVKILKGDKLIVSHKKVFELCLSPLHIYFKKASNENIPDKFAFAMSKELNKSIVVYINWLAIQQSYSDLFTHYGNTIENSYNSLQESAIFYNKAKLVPFYNLR